MNSLIFDPGTFDFEQIPAGPGVFVVETAGEPYLGKSANLRRKLTRLLSAEKQGKRLNLRDSARAIRYRPAGSVFESTVWLWHLARELFPQDYRARLRWRPPVLVKLHLSNQYPRCYLTRKLGREGLYFGPFPSRHSAEQFANAFLDLFKIRRCVEDLRPDPTHPGCVYGEMNMCLRPCQAAVSRDVYLEEVNQVKDFLSTQGQSLLRALETERELASADLSFEEAARLHKRLEKVEAALAAPELARKGGLAAELEGLHGLVIQPSAAAHAVELFPVYRGYLLPQITFSVAPDAEGKPLSLDARLRQAFSGLQLQPSGRRVEHLALLARWFYRGTRSGEFVGVEDYAHLPYRRLVNAISRVAK